MFLFEAIVPLVLLATIVGAIVGIVVLARKAKEEEPDVPGIGTTRRLFLYGLAFIALMLAVSGVSMLLSSIVDQLFNDSVFRRDPGTMAFGLAATIVGFPIWALLWRASSRSLRTYPGEAGTLGRKFYVYGVLFVATIVVAVQAIQALEDLFEGRLDASGWAWAVIWSALWYIHWRWEAAEGQPTAIAAGLRRIYVYLTAAYGLVLLAIGVGVLVGAFLSEAYVALFRDSISGGDLWTSTTRNALSFGFVGAAYWWFHWHHAAQGDTSSDSRLTLVYVVGIFGGMVTAVIGASIMVFHVLDWVFGGNESPAGSHFDVLPAGFAVAVVGAAIWGYYRAIALQDAQASPERATSAAHVYRYLSSAVGLATLGSGVAVEIGLGVGILADLGGEIFLSSGWWATPLAYSLTALLVGAGLWGRQWVLLQTRADAADPLERATQSRRAYMFAVFGIAVLATLIAASIVLFQIFFALLDGELGARVFDEVKYGIGVVAAAGIISGYHWRVMREDREVEAPEQERPARLRKQVTAVASASARGVVDAIAAASGAAITTWQRRDDVGSPTLDDAQVQAIVDQIAAAPGDRVLLMVDANGVQVIAL